MKRPQERLPRFLDPERGRTTNHTIAIDELSRGYLTWPDDEGVRVATWEDV
ncbi:MAG: hypothetical protein AB1649_28360 [Chloroflexota bacterium]